MKTLNFLKQTALDYDISLNEVKKVYEQFRGLDFYSALEQILLDRKILKNKYDS
jgi:hypothetical protein